MTGARCIARPRARAADDLNAQGSGLMMRERVDVYISLKEREKGRFLWEWREKGRFY